MSAEANMAEAIAMLGAAVEPAAVAEAAAEPPAAPPAAEAPKEPAPAAPAEAEAGPASLARAATARLEARWQRERERLRGEAEAGRKAAEEAAALKERLARLEGGLKERTLEVLAEHGVSFEDLAKRTIETGAQPPSTELLAMRRQLEEAQRKIGEQEKWRAEVEDYRRAQQQQAWLAEQRQEIHATVSKLEPAAAKAAQLLGEDNLATVVLRMQEDHYDQTGEIRSAAECAQLAVAEWQRQMGRIREALAAEPANAAPAAPRSPTLNQQASPSTGAPRRRSDEERIAEAVAVLNRSLAEDATA